LFLKTNFHIKKSSLKNKQIILLGVSIILICAIVLTVLISIKKRDEIKVTDNIPDYIVTEYFIDSNNERTLNYEARYYRRLQKTYLVLTKENKKEKQNTISEMKSKYTNEIFDFSVNKLTSPKVIDLNPYVDESGFIYTCELDKIEEFLANEISQGSIRFVNATPLYYECYIEDKGGKIYRGLILYNADLKTGTFLYKQCMEGIDIPSVTDVVEVVDKNNK
jgi:hypothetical protein